MKYETRSAYELVTGWKSNDKYDTQKLNDKNKKKKDRKYEDLGTIQHRPETVKNRLR